jgi:hypothetical protein
MLQALVLELIISEKARARGRRQSPLFLMRNPYRMPLWPRDLYAHRRRAATFSRLPRQFLVQCHDCR